MNSIARRRSASFGPGPFPGRADEPRASSRRSLDELAAEVRRRPSVERLHAVFGDRRRGSVLRGRSGTGSASAARRRTGRGSRWRRGGDARRQHDRVLGGVGAAASGDGHEHGSARDPKGANARTKWADRTRSFASHVTTTRRARGERGGRHQSSVAANCDASPRSTLLRPSNVRDAAR